MGLASPHHRLVTLTASLVLACGGAADASDDDSTSAADGSTTAAGSTGPAPQTSSGPADDSTSTPGSDGATTVPNPVCGNGVLEDPEQCDDGNTDPGDGCDADCTETIDTTLWTDTVAGAAMVEESGQGVAIDAEGNVVVIGWIVDAVDDANIWIRKYTPAGTEVWTTVLDPSLGDEDRGYGIDVGDDGSLAVSGAAGPDIWLGRLDPAGALLWSTTVDGPAGQVDIGEDVALDSTGAMWATGSVRVGMNDDDIWVAKYDPVGNLVDATITPGPMDGLDRGLGVAVDADDAAVVVGFVSADAFGRDVWLRKLDAAGAEVWTVTHDSANHGVDIGYDVAVAPDGSIGVAGSTPVIATNEDIWLGRFAGTDGAIIWQKDYGGPAILDDHGLGVAIDADANFVVCGFKGMGETDTDIWVRKWDDAGNVVWTQTLAGAGGNRDEAVAIAVGADGDLAVTGQIRNADGNDGDIWVGLLGP